MVRTNTAFNYLGRSLAAAAVTACAVTAISAQTSDDQAALDYAALLQQIADLETSIAHKEVYVGSQEARIANLQGQIEAVPATIESLEPMIAKMKVAISSEIESDLPFNAEERFARLGNFEEKVEDEAVSTADKWRLALGIYDAEVSYGQSIQAYAGDHPVENAGSRLAACEADMESDACGLNKKQKDKIKEGATIAGLAAELKDGHYLRYGRLSLAYMQADESEVLRYDAGSKTWVTMSGSKALDIRRAMKMARGESAPTVVQAPIYLAN